jgi:hypothetical protein
MVPGARIVCDAGGGFDFEYRFDFGTCGGHGGHIYTDVRLTDAVAAQADQQISIVVNAQPSIENASPLPSALFAVPYSQQLSAADGTLPFSWDISTGSLPAGLSFSPAGTLAGTPMQAGTFNFRVRITDASSSVDSKPYQLTVAPGNSESIRISGATIVSGKTSLK